MDQDQCEKPSTSEENNLPDSTEDNSMPSLKSYMYLESLGLVLNNGRPRFKLDEPVTTALNTSTTMTTDFNVDNEDDNLSFVVLGKNSMDTIQASSLASYVDIQQKSMSIDYNSIVSSLNASEVQQKLTEMLQENIKLKETLKQNNLAMKQQFNTLATWQEEVMMVHQNHKQQFAETRDFINHLKKENTELKIKLSTQQAENTEHGFEAINTLRESDSDDVSGYQVKLNYSDQEKMPLLVEELNNSKLHCTNLEEDIERYKDMFNMTDMQLTQARQLIEDQALKVKKLELELAMESISCNCSQNSIKTLEKQKCSTCSAKDQEIARLNEEVALLMEKSQCILTPIQLHDLPDSSTNQNRQKFIQNMKQCNDRLQELTECFIAQIDRFTVIKKCLKEIIDVLEVLDDDKFYLKSEMTDGSLSSETQFHQYREKLHNCHKELVDEQVKIITDRQILIKSQNQFQKVLSDYNSILYELEITIDENAKLNALHNNIIRDSLRKQAKLEKTMCDKQSLEEEKRIFNQEKDNLEEERKLLESQKKSLDTERESLLGERELLQQEKVSLNEEKTSLDHQSQLYEDQEKTLQSEKKLIQVHYELLLVETNSLRQDVQKKDIELKELQQQLAQSTEENNLLKTQLTLYEEDFKQEKKLKESLFEEKSKLDVELQKQVEFNKQLQQDIRVLQGGRTTTSSHFTSKPTSEYSSEASAMPPCPKCEMAFISIQALTEHIEKCLNLN